jgi:hypothetical protein
LPRPCYEDARFFWRNDLRTPPEQLKQGLSKLTFEERLGSMADRAARIAVIAEQLGEPVELSGEERAVLVRAGQLAKFDRIEIAGLCCRMRGCSLRASCRRCHGRADRSAGSGWRVPAPISQPRKSMKPLVGAAPLMR